MLIAALIQKNPVITLTMQKKRAGWCRGEATYAVLVCGTGIGMCIAANKMKGIRAALCGDEFSAHFTRAHNDANVLTLGARVIGPGLAESILDTFLSSEFEGGRHARRLEKIKKIENEEL